jgi:hypothetical protein
MYNKKRTFEQTYRKICELAGVNPNKQLLKEQQEIEGLKYLIENYYSWLNNKNYSFNQVGVNVNRDVVLEYLNKYKSFVNDDVLKIINSKFDDFKSQIKLDFKLNDIDDNELLKSTEIRGGFKILGKDDDIKLKFEKEKDALEYCKKINNTPYDGKRRVGLFPFLYKSIYKNNSEKIKKEIIKINNPFVANKSEIGSSSLIKINEAINGAKYVLIVNSSSSALANTKESANKSHLELAKERALSVKNFIESKGVKTFLPEESYKLANILDLNGLNLGYGKNNTGVDGIQDVFGTGYKDESILETIPEELNELIKKRKFYVDKGQPVPNEIKNKIQSFYDPYQYVNLLVIKEEDLPKPEKNDIFSVASLTCGFKLKAQLNQPDTRLGNIIKKMKPYGRQAIYTFG